MFFDIGWPELLLIGVVALVVIGPKDLPRAMRIAGYWMRKARTLSREFQSSIDQMIREAELEEVRQELKKATELNLESEFQKTIDPTGEIAESIRPPDLPDYFDETPSQSALAEPAAEIATSASDIIAAISATSGLNEIFAFDFRAYCCSGAAFRVLPPTTNTALTPSTRSSSTA